MILWTIQHANAWSRAEQRGSLRADGRRVWRVFRESYAWMAREMERRVGPAPVCVSYPVWAWLQWESAAAPRPDLRATAHLPAGTAGLRIEFESNANEVLLSDFDLWHFVLNSWYLPRSASARDRYALTAKQRSWQRIFDLSFTAHGVAVPRQRKSIQGVIWQVPLESVRSVKPFVARGKAG
jgi:hypothetical protein